MLLAIDTATRYMSLALHDGDTLLAEHSWLAGNQHNSLLASSISEMLQRCEVSTEAISAVAVSHGPGSYTGLRIGVSLAKGIAGARDLPLIGVSTLDTLAVGQPFQNTRYTLLAILQAGRGRIICGEYRVKKGRWVAEEDPRLTQWDDLFTNEDVSYYVTGEVDETGRSSIEAARGRGLAITLISAAYRARRAGFMAQEAWRRLQEGQPEDFHPDKLIPIYLKSD